MDLPLLGRIRENRGQIIRERIDRAMANALWIEKFPDNAVIHLPRTKSDHHPIMTNCYGLDNPTTNRPFRFEASWFTHPDCEPILRHIWDNSSDIIHAISQVPDKLIPCNKEHFGNIFRRKKKVLARLAGIQSSRRGIMHT